IIGFLSLLVTAALVDRNYLPNLGIFTTPGVVVEQSIIFALDWCVAGVFFYHTLRQLSLVSHIYQSYTKVSLLKLAPVYAFSGLTVRTSLGTALIVYLWIATAPSQITDPGWFSITLAILLIAGITFVLPLAGMHRMLIEE